MSTAHALSITRPLSGNFLKLIAALTMLLDHIGVMFFPQHSIFRILGRLAFPIFAFMIAEGCHYTRNRLRYFLSIFLLGALCQTVYYVFSRDTYLNILLTFSCSIPLIYLLQEWKVRKNWLFMFPFAAAVAVAFVLNQYVTLDYGFWGMMVPVFTALCYPSRDKKLGAGHHILAVCLLGVGLLLLAIDYEGVQYYSLLTLPLLLLYSGKRGKGNFKYAFYLFYPLHLVALQAIAWLLTR